MRLVGTTVRGIRTPIIKENDVNRVFFVKKNIIILNGLDK